MTRVLMIVALLALAGCSTDTAPAPPPSAPPPASSPAPPPEPAADACGASRYQNLVGRPRTEIPTPVDPGKQRVACASCPITMDFNPERLNFFFDSATGLIKEVRCG